MFKTVLILIVLLLVGAITSFYLVHKDKIHFFANEYWYSRGAFTEPVNFDYEGKFISIPITHNDSDVSALFDTGSQTVKPVRQIPEDIKSNSALMRGKGFDGRAIDAYFHSSNSLAIAGNKYAAYVGYVDIDQIENGDKLLDRFGFLLGPELLPSKGLLYIDNVRKKLIPSTTKINYRDIGNRLKFKTKVQFPTPKIYILLSEELDWFLLDTGSSTEITSTSSKDKIAKLYKSLKLPSMESFKQGQRNVIGIPFVSKFNIVELNYDEEAIYFLK